MLRVVNDNYGSIADGCCNTNCGNPDLVNIFQVNQPVNFSTVRFGLELKLGNHILE